MNKSPQFFEAMAAYDSADESLALRLMERCAEAGEPAACYMAALWYRNGEGTPPDLKRCAHWLKRLEQLAEDGNLDAQYELNGMHRWGDLLPVDIRLANHWLERAAEGGHGEAQHHLAIYYEFGEYDYPVDRVAAENWYQRAFEQGHPETLYLFAMRQFEDGKPTEYALELLRKAAANGLKQAENVLHSIKH